MSRVGQQELMAPPPGKRLIVPRGHTAAWGVDGSTLRVALARLWRDERGQVQRDVGTTSFSPLAGPARLSEVYDVTKRAAEALMHAAGPRPGLILVEQPSGKAPNLELVYAIGVIQAALFDGIYKVSGLPPQMRSCTSSWWKARACGRGNLYKPQKVKGGPRPEQTDYAVFRWAVESGWAPASWDEADAAGVAEAAAREFELVER